MANGGEMEKKETWLLRKYRGYTEVAKAIYAYKKY